MSSTTRQVVKSTGQGFLVGLAVILVIGLLMMGWAAATDGEATLWGLFEASASLTSLEFDFRLDASPWVWLVPALGALVGAVRGSMAVRDTSLAGQTPRV